MTAAEFQTLIAKAQDEAHREYAPDMDQDHDRYGNDKRDHRVFDHNHPEDAFPY